MCVVVVDSPPGGCPNDSKRQRVGKCFSERQTQTKSRARKKTNNLELDYCANNAGLVGDATQNIIRNLRTAVFSECVCVCGCAWVCVHAIRRARSKLSLPPSGGGGTYSEPFEQRARTPAHTPTHTHTHTHTPQQCDPQAANNILCCVANKTGSVGTIILFQILCFLARMTLLVIVAR